MANENEGVQTQATTEPTKYLDKAGLTTFWGKVKALVTAAVATIGSYTVNGKEISTNPVLTKADIGLGNVDNVKQIPYSEKGAKNGVATLDANGMIPAEQLGNLDTDLYIIVDKLPTTGQKTNKIYLMKNLSKPGNVYTEYGWVNGAWETLGTFSSEVDLAPYAKLDGGNTFTGSQTFRQASDSTTSVYIEGGHVQVSGDDTDLTVTDHGIKVTDGSASEAFATNGTTINMDNYVGKTDYNTDKTNLTNALNNKAEKSDLNKYLPLTGGTVTGNLSVAGPFIATGVTLNDNNGTGVVVNRTADQIATIHFIHSGVNTGYFGQYQPNTQFKRLTVDRKTSYDILDTSTTGISGDTIKINNVSKTIPTKLSELTDDNVLNGKYVPTSRISTSRISSPETNILTRKASDESYIMRGGDRVTGEFNFNTDKSGFSVTIDAVDGLTVTDNNTTNMTMYSQGFINNSGSNLSLPSKAGTLALDEKFADYLPLTGGTISGILNIIGSGKVVYVACDNTPAMFVDRKGITASHFIRMNGTSTQALMADGTVAERIDETEIAAICV